MTAPSAGAAPSTGIAFPAAADGSRSTSTLGRQVLSDALAAVDPVGAREAREETNWRSGYVRHLRRAVEAGLASRNDAERIAAHGLASLHSRMLWSDGVAEHPLETVLTARPGRNVTTETVRGTSAAETELTLPLHGERLRGDALHRHLDAWRTAGIVEPSVVDAVTEVMAHPEWLRLPDHTVAVLGAGAEMGPLQALLRWGATVVAVDLPVPAVWERVLQLAAGGAGVLHYPVGEGAPGAAAAGIDLTAELPTAAQWLTEQTGNLVLGNYVYADGAENLRVSMALDALTLRLQRDRPDLALAFLATPTDVFGVPADAVAHATRSYEGRSRRGRIVGRPLRAVSAGRLLQRNYRPDADPGVNDTIVAQQGPNYLLAKRIHRWRAAVAREAGTLVSMNVAPPTRTRSVVKNRVLAAAYAGAHRFGIEVFEPATSNTLMAALLVHDLHTGGGPTLDHVWQDEAHSAVHGGLWRAAYTPRSALGLAALLGYGASRG